jgi:hypothetical protein
MQSDRLQRGAGAALALMGAGFTVWHWIGPAAAKTSSLTAVFGLPFLGVLGVAALVAPISRRDLLERFGVDRPQSLSHYTAAQKILCLLALLAGSANLVAQLTLR